MASNCISQQDFLAIREETLELIPARFDRLCRTADALLRPYVMSRTSHVRSDPNFAQDVLQDIQMKLIQSIVTRFFLREDRPDEDKTALGLTRWMFAIARNTILTHLTASSQRIPVSLLQASACWRSFASMGMQILSARLISAMLRYTASRVSWLSAQMTSQMFTSCSAAWHSAKMFGPSSGVTARFPTA